ncbi:MAG: hypothetical protein ACK4M3_05765 [Pyrobaculum sp.]
MRVLVYILSPVAAVLGLLFLINAVSNPSLDPTIQARDLGISIVAVVLGILAPILVRKFSRE